MRGRGGQRGQAIVLIALMMAVLVGFVALAIDSARAFDGRRIMQDAVDNAALAAAEYYQNNPGGWSGAEAAATAVFTADNRLYTGRACIPGLVAPAPGGPGTPLSMTCTFGTTSYQLTITAEDDGPAGQSFLLTGQRSLDVALMQVLGQSPTLTVRASGAATATDQARTPVLAALSSSGCYGAGGTAMNISVTTNPVTVVGDVVVNGSFFVAPSSFPHIGGNVLTRCGAPTNGSTTITYYCWPGTAPAGPGAAATPCTSPAVPGRLLTTAGHFADPGYSAPSGGSGINQPTPGSNVIVNPGVYAADPQFGSASAACYFLAAGVYQWQAGMTVNAGVVSNELKPPDEPSTASNTSRATHQFWRDNSANCDGAFALSSNSAPGKGVQPGGNWAVVVTAVRTDNGAVRESAPSMCRLVSVGGTDKNITVDVSNVPGATSYNVYAAPPAVGCTGPFGLVGSITASTGSTSALANCPDTTGTLGCSLGHSGGPAPAPGGGAFDNGLITSSFTPNCALAPDAFQACPPDGETAAWPAGANSPAVCFSLPCLPNQNAARGASTTAGDRANENYCATAAGARAICPAASTPGAVVMSLTNGSCFNVKGLGSGGDVYLFSGYQYDWLLNYEPPGTACTNTWRGNFNSAAIGLTYTPGAAVNIAGYDGFSGYTGGVMAGTILIQSASGLLLDFSRYYAPAPGGTRLTG